MSLYRRGDVYWSKIMHRGILHRRSLMVSTLREARQLEAALQVGIANGELGLKKAPTVVEFTEQFINFLPNRVKKTTYNNYVSGWARLQAFEPLAKARLNEINTVLVDKFVKDRQDKGAAIASINHDLRVLSRALHLAKEWGLIKTAPKMHLLRGENQREFVINPTDEQKLIDAIQHKTVKLLFPFLVDTGLRPIEAVTLTWDQVSDAGVTIREGKTKNARRTVPLTERAKAILKTIKETMPSSLPQVFTRSKGRATVSADLATHMFKEAVRKAGVSEDCVLYSARHTFCSRLGKAKCSPYVLQKLAGHGSITISARYCHPDAEQLEGAIAKLNK